jgi:hypothetical protein
MDDFFAELEAEISQHIAADKLKKDRDAAKKRANNGQLPTAIRQAASATFKELSKLIEINEWASVKTIALFTEQTCDGCGSIHRTFLQYMQMEQLVRKPTTQRWVRVSRPSLDLPRESLIQPMTTHLCADCCEDHGFALLSAERLAPRTENLAPSFTYVQEDINAEAA